MGRCVIKLDCISHLLHYYANVDTTSVAFIVLRALLIFYCVDIDKDS